MSQIIKLVGFSIAIAVAAGDDHDGVTHVDDEDTPGDSFPPIDETAPMDDMPPMDGGWLLTDAPATNTPPPTNVVAMKSTVEGAKVENDADANEQGGAMCDAFETDINARCKFEGVCSSIVCYGGVHVVKIVGSRGALALQSNESWTFAFNFASAQEQVSLREEISQKAESVVTKVVKAKAPNATYTGSETTLVATFESTQAPSTAAPPTPAPVRTIVTASLVLEAEVNDTAAAKAVGDALCGVIEKNSGITCEYTRACAGTTECFGEAAASQQSRGALVLEVKEWSFDLELTSEMAGSELEKLLQDEGETIVTNADVGGTFVRVSIAAGGSFNSTEAPETESPPIPETPAPPTAAPTGAPATPAPQSPAPDTVTPTRAPVSGRGLDVDFTLLASVVPTDAAVVQAGADMAVVLRRAIASRSIRFLAGCQGSDCRYPAAAAASQRTAALQQATNLWTFSFDVDTDVENDEIVRLARENAADLANALSPQAEYLGARPAGGPDDDDDGLGGGAIAGIVIGCIAFCVVMSAVVAFLVLKKKGSSENVRDLGV
ncbi:hypothetical protein DIPPA_18161 [Diplonema papillatum]|nr:hypothetical protein DIPPA_18161 [Diplonema papillatum]